MKTEYFPCLIAYIEPELVEKKPVDPRATYLLNISKAKSELKAGKKVLVQVKDYYPQTFEVSKIDMGTVWQSGTISIRYKPTKGKGRIVKYSLTTDTVIKFWFE